MEARFGFIGADEVAQAKQELIREYQRGDGSWMNKKLWFEKPHLGDNVRGYAYDDVREVLEAETESYYEEFTSMEEVQRYLEEVEYTFPESDISKLEKIFAANETAYLVDDEIDDDKGYLCWDRIKDGQYMWRGTVEKAYNELEEWNGWNEYNQTTELLVIGLLG